MSLFSRFDAHAPRVLSGPHIVAGLMFMQPGAQKLFSFPAEAVGPFNIASQMGIGGVLEPGGGALIVLGLFTRPVAFLLSGMMAVAYFQMHCSSARVRPSRWLTKASWRRCTAGSSCIWSSPDRANGPSTTTCRRASVASDQPFGTVTVAGPNQISMRRASGQIRS